MSDTRYYYLVGLIFLVLNHTSTGLWQGTFGVVAILAMVWSVIAQIIEWRTK